MTQPKHVEPYDHGKIEKKWQEYWNSRPELYHATDAEGKENLYMLVEFPFPSGAGLHIGHVRSYAALDIIARKNRMQGKNVLYPIGWDAFGLPTENYAIKTGLQPSVVTKQNSDNFRKQLKSLGFSFDWQREINSSSPEYFKWTQWIFLQFLKAGLAYRDKISINWCPKDKIGLANEEVVGGCCERCGTKVEKREKEQWMLAITKYAERLDKDLDLVDYPERVKLQQRNWIGKSEGSEIDFKIEGSEKLITVFTTRPDTLYGVTYVVIAPEHSLINELSSQIKNIDEVKEYIKSVAAIDETERTAADKEKTGIVLEGIFAIHPITGEKVPVWTADYVLATYGTGAVMAVPAHDERDFEFAKKFSLNVKKVIDSEGFGTPGKLINSDKFNGTDSESAKQQLTEAAGGRMVTKFKLRDWVFSRQRYWGEPIPVVHCSACAKIVPLPESELPLELPPVEKYEPTDNGESPLAAIESWVNTTCPECGGPAKRETDTMPNWAGSSWYYLRYADPHNNEEFASKEKLAKWSPVSWYNGGMEHTTLHLLYSRFWHKFLYDQGHVPTPEPYAKRTSHGLIMADDGSKMSKSKGNIVNPDDIVKTYGADTLRLFEMFIGPFEQAVAWNSDGLIGPRRFIERVHRLVNKVSDSGELSKESVSLLHKTIKKIGDDIETLAMNTAVSSLMILVNQLEKESVIPTYTFKQLIALMAPFTPHLAEELHEIVGGSGSVFESAWPEYDPSLIVDEDAKIAVQINGKVRVVLTVSQEEASNEALITEKALAQTEVSNRVGDKSPDKVIFIPKKVINLVFKGL